MIKNILYKYLEHKAIIESEKEKKVEYQLHWSPSYYCRCLRQTYFKKIGESITNPLPIHTLLKFEMGNGIHYQLKELYKRVAIFYNEYKQFGVNFEYIEGGDSREEIEWDNIKWIYIPDDLIKVKDKEFIIENKTKYGQGIEIVKKFGVEKDYEIQELLYMTFKKIKAGEIFFVATDSAYCEDFAYTDKILIDKYRKYIGARNKKIKEIINDVKLFYDTGEKKLPDKEGQINLKKYNNEIRYEFTRGEKYKSYPCTWSSGTNKCMWFDVCWKKDIDYFLNSNYNFYIDGKYYWK